MNQQKKIFLILIVVLFASLFFIYYEAENSVGDAQDTQVIMVEKGDGIFQISRKLENEKLISKETFFIYYVFTHEILGKIIAGEYEIAPGFTIPEISQILISGKTKPDYAKVTFPEGWTAVQMAERLNAKNLPGDDFLEIINKPPQDLLDKFDFIADKPSSASLEGYLFPDTYFFSHEVKAKDIAEKMLKNFNTKLSDNLRSEIKRQNKSIFEILTMASVVESEVGSNSDRKIVSGIFWKRLEIGMALQSDATVAYALGGKKKIQHDVNDINIDSPYNTYKFKGLPPGPVSNPGLSSIEAAIFPTKTNYLYFLNNPKTGETFFSTTFEQHTKNKVNNGL